MKVSVIHNQTAVDEDRRNRLDHNNPEGKPCGMFFDFCENCYATVAYTYEATPEQTDLDYIYRANNAVDGSEIEVKPNDKRSLSVGDVVVLDAAAFKVENYGFSPIDFTTVVQAVSNQVPAGYTAL